MTAPTVDTPQGDERIVVLCEKGCRYLGFTSGAVNQCPHCELSKSADTLLVALTRAQDAESALLAARREVEALRPATKRALKFCDLALDEAAKDGTDRVLIGVELFEELIDKLRAALAATPEEK